MIKVWVQSDERARLERLQQRTNVNISAVDASLGQKMKLDFEAPGGIFAIDGLWEHLIIKGFPAKNTCANSTMNHRKATVDGQDWVNKSGWFNVCKQGTVLLH